jgi:hypothetical protein
MEKYMTIQEAADAAGFEDYMLENGGGIRVWDTCCGVGVVYTDEQVYALAKIAIEEKKK